MTLRRTALVRRTELRRTPMTRKTPPAAAKALRTRTSKARRDTGPTAAVREIVYARAGGCCEICGKRVRNPDGTRAAAFSVHHRQPRGMGGTSRPEANWPSNLLLLCGDATSTDGCHAFVETNRAQAYDAGWLVRRPRNPARAPVIRLGSAWWRLNEDGTISVVELADGGPA